MINDRYPIPWGQVAWIEGLYNLIQSGPPGVGKTHLAIGLGYQACEEGYKVSYTTMQSLIKTLRTEEIDRHSGVKMRRIRASNLLIIDEVGYLPINAKEEICSSSLYLNFKNERHNGRYGK